MEREHLKKLYRELTDEQLKAEIRWRDDIRWTIQKTSGADCMIVPMIKSVCKEILKERGAGI